MTMPVVRAVIVSLLVALTHAWSGARQARGSQPGADLYPVTQEQALDPTALRLKNES